MSDPFRARFMDGSTPSDQYLAAVAGAIETACDVEEACGLEECERAADRARAGQAYIDRYGKGYEVVMGNWVVYTDTSPEALRRCMAVRKLPVPFLERLRRARYRLDGAAAGYSRRQERITGERMEQFKRLRQRLNEWALAETEKESAHGDPDV